MTIFVLCLAFVLGMFVGAFSLWHGLPERVKDHIDYKERWQKAVDLLAEGNQLTEEQVKSLSVPAKLPPEIHIMKETLTREAWDRREKEAKAVVSGSPA